MFIAKMLWLLIIIAVFLSFIIYKFCDPDIYDDYNKDEDKDNKNNKWK